MSRRGWAACGAGAVIVLGAVGSAFINELGKGWQWWAGAGAVVLAAAVITARLTLRAPDGQPAGDRLDRGAVKVDGDVHGPIQTTTYLLGPVPDEEAP